MHFSVVFSKSYGYIYIYSVRIILSCLVCGLQCHSIAFWHVLYVFVVIRRVKYKLARQTFFISIHKHVFTDFRHALNFTCINMISCRRKKKLTFIFVQLKYLHEWWLCESISTMWFDTDIHEKYMMHHYLFYIYTCT
jgi:hypothetical protein